MTRQWLRDFARFVEIVVHATLAAVAAATVGLLAVVLSILSVVVPIVAVVAAVFFAVQWLSGCQPFPEPTAPERIGAGQVCEECTRCTLARPLPGSLVQLTPVLPYDDNALWDDFTTVTLVSQANTNGRSYPLELRWNDPPVPVVGTMLQMVGGANMGWVREAYTYGRSFQDSLAALGIRSVNVQYLGGSDAFPRNGWCNISATYADAIAWMIQAGVVEGALYGYGNSGGACVLANTLLNQRVPFAGVIFGGGPFGIDFVATGCLLQEINAYNFEDVGGCDAASDSLRACRSTLGPASLRLLPDTDVVVLVGTADPRGAFITGEAQRLLAGIRARSEHFGTPAAPHQILNTLAGRDAMLRAVEGWL